MSADTAAPPELKRKLKARHINMIAMGGAIGTGLFVASGKSIHDAGPGGALAAYAAIGLMVFLLMQSLGEMATYLPMADSSARRSASPPAGTIGTTGRSPSPPSLSRQRW